MHNHYNLAVLYIIELSTPAYISLEGNDNIINDVTNDIIGIK